jgi:hypothetical protein
MIIFMTVLGTTEAFAGRSNYHFHHHHHHHHGLHNRKPSVREIMFVADDHIDNDPPSSWAILEEIQVWMTQNSSDDNRGEICEMQNAINDLRNECHFNIHTLEKEIMLIQQTIEHNNNSYSSSSSYQSMYHHDEDFIDDIVNDANNSNMPTLKAVFAGYKVTNEDRLRLMSAHPEEYSC